jgi:hypothetical protein
VSAASHDHDLDALIERLAPRVAEIVVERLLAIVESPDRWLTSVEAADYLGLTVYALDKLCAARVVPFEQDKRGGKRWFKTADLDGWRRGQNGS